MCRRADAGVSSPTYIHPLHSTHQSYFSVRRERKKESASTVMTRHRNTPRHSLALVRIVTTLIGQDKRAAKRIERIATIREEKFERCEKNSADIHALEARPNSQAQATSKRFFRDPSSSIFGEDRNFRPLQHTCLRIPTRILLA